MNKHLQKISMLFLIIPLNLMAQTVGVYAHRGLSELLPESTLASYQAAMRLGVDVIDMDVHVTKDDVAVVVHDPQLMAELTRDGNGNWLIAPTPAIKDMTFAQLQEFDVGRLNPQSYLAEQFPNVKGVDGQRIPSLRSMIEYAEKNGGNYRYQIELKVTPYENTNQPSQDKLLDAVFGVVNELGVLEKVELQSFDFSILLKAKQREPKVKLSFVTQETGDLDTIRAAHQGNKSWTAGFDVADYHNSTAEMVAKLGASVWNPYYVDLTKEKIDKAHQFGLKVIPWTVNREAHMHKMIEMGVDGIITNRADILRGVLAVKGFSVPQPATLLAEENSH